MKIKLVKLSVISLLMSSTLFSACNPFSNKKDEVEFETPRDQYGAKYSVGDLGGKPVHLGREAPWVEYEDNAGFVPDRKYKHKVRTYASKIQSFGFDMRYTDGLVLVEYYKAPKYSKEQYKKEIGLPDNHWVSVGVNSDKNYYGDLTTRLKNSSLETNTMSKENLERFYYSHVYLPTDEYIYGLQKYIPHPEWVKYMERSKRKNFYNNKSLYDIEDFYVKKDSNGKVLTLIKCGHSEYPIAETCELEFVLEPKMKVRLSAIFQSVHLKDWELIQQQAKKVVEDFIVKPNYSKGEKNG